MRLMRKKKKRKGLMDEYVIDKIRNCVSYIMYYIYLRIIKSCLPKATYQTLYHVYKLFEGTLKILKQPHPLNSLVQNLVHRGSNVFNYIFIRCLQPQ